MNVCISIAALLATMVVMGLAIYAGYNHVDVWYDNMSLDIAIFVGITMVIIIFITLIKYKCCIERIAMQNFEEEIELIEIDNEISGVDEEEI